MKLLCAALLTTLPLSVFAYNLSENFSVEGTITSVFQHGAFSDTNIKDTTRGTVVTDITTNYRPTNQDELELVVSFASGDSLNDISPFSTPAYADDLEDDLEDINGRGRDYVLTAWYKHTFMISENTSFGLTAGIIDATEYVDDNTFANDEVSQFMNEIFVNNTLFVPPSYDAGIVGELEFAENWSLKGTWMNSKNVDRTVEEENGLDRTYNYYAGQLEFHPKLAYGQGNYRLMAYATSNDFADSDGTGTKNIHGLNLSLDQELGETFGMFARFAWQDDDAGVDHDEFYTSGLWVNGSLWGRPNDEAGFGYAYLEGTNDSINDTDALEGYIKFQLFDHADISFDVQYVDQETDNEEDDPYGFIYGIRLNAYL